MSAVMKLTKQAKKKAEERLEICSADWRRAKKRMSQVSRVEWTRKAAMVLFMADLVLTLWLH